MTAPRLVKDIHPGAAGASPSGLIAFNNRLVFAASDGRHGFELWGSDGSSGGTTLLADLAVGGDSSFPGRFLIAGDQLFFTANATVFSEELWVSDGTTAGTRRIPGVNPSKFSVNNLAALNGRVLFTNGAGDLSGELWSSDGTAAGTALVKEIQLSGYGGSNPSFLTTVGNHVYFSADDDTSGRELWRSDGTTAGTVLVRDIAPGGSSFFPNQSIPEQLTAVGERLFFTADDGLHGRELWLSDGSAAGTRLVKDITTGNSSVASGPVALTAVGSRLFFTVDDGLSGQELWVSDGTATGTRLVKDIQPGSAGSGPRNLTAVGDTLFFCANDGRSGTELWRSDGTTEGTQLVRDILTPSGPDFDGTSGFGPQKLTAIEDRLYFSAETFTAAGFTGLEPWVSDGTTAGTVMLADLQQGQIFPYQGSEPSGFTAVNDQLFFSAVRDGVGSELWALDLITEPPSPPDPITGGGMQDPIAVNGRGTLRGTAGVANRFRFLNRDRFGRAGAETIIGFNASEGDRLVFARDVLPGIRRASLRSVASARAARKALASSSSFVYQRNNGALLFNGNGRSPGFGTGGLVAILEGAPALTATSLELI